MNGWRKLTSGTALWPPRMGVRLAQLPGRLRAARDQATSCRRCRLAWAAVLSLSLHVGLLSTVTRPSASLSGDALFVTVLPAPAAPVDVAARTEPAPQPAQASLRPPDVPRSSVPRSSVAVAAPTPATSSAIPAGSTASTATRPSVPAKSVSVGPIAAAPLGRPQLRDDLRRQLVTRRLLVRVSVDAAGAVNEAVFVSPELDSQVLAELVDAVSRVRFAPARAEGRTVGSVFSARLCFDDDGVLQDGPECWIPASR
jgi:hypothetical protein